MSTDTAGTAPATPATSSTLLAHARYVIGENLLTAAAFVLFALFLAVAVAGPCTRSAPSSRIRSGCASTRTCRLSIRASRGAGRGVGPSFAMTAQYLCTVSMHKSCA